MTDLADPRIWPALSYEVDETSALLNHSAKLMATLRAPDDVSPLFACLATGTERLLKLVHGLAVQDETGQWPSRHEMSQQLSHALLELDRRCRTHVRRGVPRATHPTYIQSLLDKVEAGHATALIAALDRYARGGRFHNLDTLADKPPGFPAPRVLWEQLELEVLKSRPDLLSGLGAQGGWEAARTWMNQELRNAYLSWWDLYVRAAMHGCFGAVAKQWLSAQRPLTVG
jgi:hypothetical protein